LWQSTPVTTTIGEQLASLAASTARLLYLAEVLKVQLQELFPTRPPGNRIYDFIEKLETTRFSTPRFWLVYRQKFLYALSIRQVQKPANHS
jgi:hypothetical protein